MLIIDCIYEIKQIDKEIQLLNYVKQKIIKIIYFMMKKRK